MQTRMKHWQASELGWLGSLISAVIVLLPMVGLAVDTNPAVSELSKVPTTQESAVPAPAPSSSNEVNAFFPNGNVVSPEQKVLLMKEQELVGQTATALASENKDVVPTGDTWTTAIKPTPKVYNSVPYTQPKTFTSNPLVAGDVRLAYRPSVLNPMGEEPPKRTVIHAPEPPKPEKETEVAKKEETPKPVAAPVVQPKDSNPALTAFLEWVRSTSDAAEMARKEVERKTQVAKATGSEGMFEKDLFLTIRFPYTGAEPPPSNTSLIYSVPPAVSH